MIDAMRPVSVRLDVPEAVAIISSFQTMISLLASVPVLAPEISTDQQMGSNGHRALFDSWLWRGISD
jgi:hypothetical protein